MNSLESPPNSGGMNKEKLQTLVQVKKNPPPDEFCNLIYFF
jgi:hypothetical protein